MHIIPVTSLEDHELEPYRTLRARTQHWKEGYCVTEGEKAVRALLASQLTVHSLLLTESWLRHLEAELQSERFVDTKAFVATDELMEGIVGFSLHKSLLAMGMVPVNPTLEQLHERSGGAALHVALEGIADAENMGMILRNCAAFGVRSMIVGADSSSPWMRRSIRVSLGNVFAMTIHHADNLLETLQRCREEFGWHVVGTTPRGGKPRIDRVDAERPRHICLLFGSEAHGLTDAALAHCDSRFSIPMRNDVDSINVANAVAVTLYEATRSSGQFLFPQK
ncbi:MAG: RNA methyltransferase [Bacteroidetes bacterium]|nr:RNA methyltransferase [Bacteroidota bacterium]